MHFCQSSQPGRRLFQSCLILKAIAEELRNDRNLVSRQRPGPDCTEDGGEVSDSCAMLVIHNFALQ